MPGLVRVDGHRACSLMPSNAQPHGKAAIERDDVITCTIDLNPGPEGGRCQLPPERRAARRRLRQRPPLARHRRTTCRPGRARERRRARAVSLSMDERVALNFGDAPHGTPWRGTRLCRLRRTRPRPDARGTGAAARVRGARPRPPRARQGAFGCSKPEAHRGRRAFPAIRGGDVDGATALQAALPSALGVAGHAQVHHARGRCLDPSHHARAAIQRRAPGGSRTDGGEGGGGTNFRRRRRRRAPPLASPRPRGRTRARSRPAVRGARPRAATPWSPAGRWRSWRARRASGARGGAPPARGTSPSGRVGVRARAPGAFKSARRTRPRA